eukprot:TRINITY_DN29992_c0_g1_i2.p1 TRINITY_DN29992_c0_g1~~TRINITY_DN29992_c0_g1_i2.p1  ORF type:complete len:157 (+),score=31.95 TRINITY_DN29992_c0_g1_i2:151-621(+)
MVQAQGSVGESVLEDAYYFETDEVTLSEVDKSEASSVPKGFPHVRKLLSKKWKATHEESKKEITDTSRSFYLEDIYSDGSDGSDEEAPISPSRIVQVSKNFPDTNELIAAAAPRHSFDQENSIEPCETWIVSFEGAAAGEQVSMSSSASQSGQASK